jgi:hypothetical protein
MRRACDPRHITSGEAAILEWLLDNAAVRDVSGCRTRPVAALEVFGFCDCGCCSLFFTPFPIGKHTMLADAVAFYPDHQKCGLILWGREKEIVWLEVYEMHPVAHRVPRIADLRRWEDFNSDPST